MDSSGPKLGLTMESQQYGLIYHSTFIGRAGNKHKGRISRFLANKCSIACRIDCFSGERAYRVNPVCISDDFLNTRCSNQQVRRSSATTGRGEAVVLRGEYFHQVCRLADLLMAMSPHSPEQLLARTLTLSRRLKKQLLPTWRRMMTRMMMTRPRKRMLLR